MIDTRNNEQIIRFVIDNLNTIFRWQGYVVHSGGKARLRWRERVSQGLWRNRSITLPDEMTTERVERGIRESRDICRRLEQEARAKERAYQCDLAWLREKLAPLGSRALRRTIQKNLAPVLRQPDGKELIEILQPWDQPLPRRGRPKGRLSLKPMGQTDLFASHGFFSKETR